MNDFRSKLEDILEADSIKTDEMMKGHTTFRIGGPADYYVTPADEIELAAVIRLCLEYGMPYFLLGNGSNLLVSDEGYRGVIIAMSPGWNTCEIHGEQVKAGAGILLPVLAKRIGEASLTGFEFAAGIPGTLGGALVMNAGAYGSEMKDVLVSAKVMDRQGKILLLSAEELELGYRTSCILKNNYVVLEGVFRLKTGESEAIRSRMEELMIRRKTKQPLEYPSAGSAFKRPEGYFAGKLIDDAGLRGFFAGGAQVSEKHCGFVVNRGQATAVDVINLCEEVSRRVYDKFGVPLEMEVKILGQIQTDGGEAYEIGHSDRDVGSGQDHRA